jgi:hypothetical protein
MPAIINKGRLQNFISGISGVTPGGTAVINMPVNLRAHRLNFQTLGIAYGVAGTTPTAVPATADAGVTFSVQTSLGVITGITATGTVSTKADGDYPILISGGLYTRPDGSTVVLGGGALATYHVATLAVTGITLISGGVASPVPPELVITSVKQQVNGVNMRDISPTNILRVALANPRGNWVLGADEFCIFFTEFWRNFIAHNEITSWDLAGQNTWQLQLGISGAISAPALVGSYEFDFERNLRPARDAKGATSMVPFLQPVKQHQFSFPVPAGRFDLTTLPYDFPIARVWLYYTDLSTGLPISDPISQLEIYQDNNKVLEQTIEQNRQSLNEYGFNTSIFDAAFVADLDGRLYKALHCAKQFIVRVNSRVASNLNVVLETLPGAFQ